MTAPGPITGLVVFRRVSGSSAPWRPAVRRSGGGVVAAEKQKLKQNQTNIEVQVEMSSDEDFSLVPEGHETLQGITASISDFKKQYDRLQEEQAELTEAQKEQQELTRKFKERSQKLSQSVDRDRQEHEEQVHHGKLKLDSLTRETVELLQLIERVEAEIQEEAATHAHLRQQTDVFTAVPRRNVVFRGETSVAAGAQTFDMTSRLVYPMNGGTALITFEDRDVALNILRRKHHQVQLGGECSINVEARPVHLMLPRLVEIDSEVCPQRVLISDLPNMETEPMLNKLEIHFSKRKHGGGEVEECELLPDTGTVVITFVDKDVAGRLTQTEYHEVQLQRKKYRVRVTPFLNGTATSLKTKMVACPRTVLLTGIPPVTEHDNLQDLLEIHFQKTIHGGGEIEAFIYNPQGQQRSALFVSADHDELAAQ